MVPRGTIYLTGKDLTVDELVKIAEDSSGQVKIQLDETAKYKIREARKGLEYKVASGSQVYGTTTRTGPEKGRSIGEGQSFQLEVAAGYGGSWGENQRLFEAGQCRAAWTILLNQFANGTNIISEELADEMVLWLNCAWDENSPMHMYLPTVERGASISYADLTAPMQLMLGTLAKKSLRNAGSTCNEGYLFKPGEVLALGSSNCFTMAEAALSLNKISKLLHLSEMSAAMDIEAERSTPFIVSKAAEDIAQWEEKKHVIERIRSMLKSSNIWTDAPSALHPFVTLRASPDIIGTAWEALNSSRKVVEGMMNGHQGNPVMVGPWNSSLSWVEVGPVCSFDSTRLFVAFSNLKQALSSLAISVTERGQHLLTYNGAEETQLFSRRFEVYLESSLRDVLDAGGVIPATMGRMNCAAGYDWAAPASQAADKLSKIVENMKKLFSVHLLISCAVINHKLGSSASEKIGSGLRTLFLSIYRNSYQHIPVIQPFEFTEVRKVVEAYINSSQCNDPADDVAEVVVTTGSSSIGQNIPTPKQPAYSYADYRMLNNKTEDMYTTDSDSDYGSVDCNGSLSNSPPATTDSYLEMPQYLH